MSRLHNRKGQSSPSQYKSDQSSRTRCNPSKVPAPVSPGLHLPAVEHLQKIEGGDQSPSRMESMRHLTNTEMRVVPTEVGEP